MSKSPDELGALWVKTGAKGEYMTGTVNGIGVVCFKNTGKAAGSNQPDWRILKAKPKEARDAQAVTAAHPLDDEVGF